MHRFPLAHITGSYVRTPCGFWGCAYISPIYLRSGAGATRRKSTKPKVDHSRLTSVLKADEESLVRPVFGARPTVRRIVANGRARIWPAQKRAGQSGEFEGDGRNAAVGTPRGVAYRRPLLRLPPSVELLRQFRDAFRFGRGEVLGFGRIGGEVVEFHFGARFVARRRHDEFPVARARPAKPHA